MPDDPDFTGFRERIGMRRIATEHARFKGEWCDERTCELARDGG